MTALGATRPVLALAKPDGFAPAFAAPPFIDAKSFALSFLLFVIGSFLIPSVGAHLGTCPMERLLRDHRFRWGLTQPPLTEYSLKKNNPPEACNSRGRLFLRATLPGARREWLSEPVMASAFRPHIAAPLV